MGDTRAIANFIKMAHLRGCGSNSVTDCGEECGYEKDMAFHQLGVLTERLVVLEAAEHKTDAEVLLRIENLRVLVYELEGWKYVIDVRLECVGQRDGSDLWAIREKGCCLNKQGEWEFEPIPSSRTNAFYERCRWKTAEAALEFWRGGHKSRFEHYRDAARAQGPKP